MFVTHFNKHVKILPGYFRKSHRIFLSPVMTGSGKVMTGEEKVMTHEEKVMTH